MEKTKMLSQELIWPAVAGNVAWAFFTVLIDEVLITKGWPWSIIVGRLLALLVLSLYLLIVYARDKGGNGKWVDPIHAVSIILCAISFQLNTSSDWMNIFLIALFFIAALGHWCGCWIPESVKGCRKCRQALAGGISFLGLILCVLLYFVYDMPDHLSLSIPMTIVLLLWLCFRDKIYEEPTASV